MIKTQLENHNIEHFRALKQIIADHQEEFPKEELDDFYRYAINYCIQKIKLDKDYFQNEALNLYVQNLKTGNLYVNGLLSQWTFKNIIKLGILCEKFDWTSSFIEEYINKLKPEQKHNAFHFNFAEMHFAKGDLDNAQIHLLKVEFKEGELAYNLGTRLMLIKIFYLKNEEEALLSQLAAFTIFLKRNKELKGERKQQFINFCNLLARILRKNKRHYPQIIEDIKHTKPLTNSEWLSQVYFDVFPTVMGKNVPLRQS